MSPSSGIKKEAEDFFVQKTADGLPIEALGLLLTLLADTERKQKRSPYADELVRYLATHVQLDDKLGTAHVPSFYDTLTRHKCFHSSTRTGRPSPCMHGKCTMWESPCRSPWEVALLLSSDEQTRSYSRRWLWPIQRTRPQASWPKPSWQAGRMGCGRTRRRTAGLSLP